MAIYPHGTLQKHAQGCRCALCELIHARYYPPKPKPAAHSIPARPVRDHIRALRDSGWMVQEIADRAGYHEGTIRNIGSGRNLWTDSLVAEDILSLPLKAVS